MKHHNPPQCLIAEALDELREAMGGQEYLVELIDAFLEDAPAVAEPASARF